MSENTGESFTFPASVKVHRPDQQELRRLRAVADHTQHVAEMAALGVAAANTKVERAREAEKAAMAGVPLAEAQLEEAERAATDAAQQLSAYLTAFDVESETGE